MKGAVTMKKTYENPVALMISALSKDILTMSLEQGYASDIDNWNVADWFI